VAQKNDADQVASICNLVGKGKRFEFDMERVLNFLPPITMLEAVCKYEIEAAKGDEALIAAAQERFEKKCESLKAIRNDISDSVKSNYTMRVQILDIFTGLGIAENTMNDLWTTLATNEPFSD
jgi:hypothetical protein